MSSTLYGWGSCDAGQLGPVAVDDPGVQVTQPAIINWPPAGVGKQLMKLVCGYRHTLALDSEGLVYSCGSNEFGQLGHDRSPNAFSKVVLFFLSFIITEFQFMKKLTRNIFK